jgi:hypothetical protein
VVDEEEVVVVVVDRGDGDGGGGGGDGDECGLAREKAAQTKLGLEPPASRTPPSSDTLPVTTVLAPLMHTTVASATTSGECVLRASGRRVARDGVHIIVDSNDSHCLNFVK